MENKKPSDFENPLDYFDTPQGLEMERKLIRLIIETFPKKFRKLVELVRS